MAAFSRPPALAVHFPRRHSPGSCPHCGSSFVQPLGWKELADGRRALYLRCPECGVSTGGSFEQEDVARYDVELVRGREQVGRQYEALVRHNMEELASRFERALALDLIGADDFEVGGGRHWLQSA
jgi:hypothetical protein